MEKYIVENIRNQVSKNGLWRPAFHFTAPKGWLNDPNGLIYYRGYYHLFYQYNPKHCNWDSMHWGHAVSKDMLSWQDLPIALYPDQPYENHPEGGCFSGCAVEKDGILYLFYSATVKDETKVYQTQCMAYSEDGVHFKKFEGNPIIAKPPKDTSDDFRDPKVFAVGDKWYMVIGGSIGGADTGGDGRVFLYVSNDLYKWEYCGNVLESNGELGTMFECPDLFEINGKWVLTCSPMYHPKQNKILYCVGTMDFIKYKFNIEKMGTLDAGFDYYAAQSFLDKKGNRILIGWQNGWLWMPWCENWGPTETEGWRGVLSIPRKAVLDDENCVCLEPINNLDTLKAVDMELEEVIISASKFELHPKDKFSYEIDIFGNVRDMESQYMEIGLLAGKYKETKISVDFITGIMTLDRSNADLYSTGKVNYFVDLKDDKFDLKIIVDHSSVEVSMCEGKYCLTANVYPEKDQTKCYIRTPYKNGFLKKVVVSSIKSIW